MIESIERAYIQAKDIVYDNIECDLRYNITKAVYDVDLFTITLEIIVKEKAVEDDYGVVFSTNSQSMSHYSFEKEHSVLDKKIFIMSDLTYGNGEEISSTEEFSYELNDDVSLEFIKDKILHFIRCQSGKIGVLMKERYDIS
jgi:hypothetical protein